MTTSFVHHAEQLKPGNIFQAPFPFNAATYVVVSKPVASHDGEAKTWEFNVHRVDGSLAFPFTLRDSTSIAVVGFKAPKTS